MSRILLVILATTILDLQDKATAQCPFSDNAVEDACKYATQNSVKSNVVSRQNSESDPALCDIQPSPCDPNSPYRTFDESCNNLENPTMGLPNSKYYRLLPAKYGDGIGSPRLATDGSALPAPRVVRTKLFPSETRPNDRLSQNLMVWSQILAHDMSMLKMPESDVPCCTAEGKYIEGLDGNCYPIRVPPSDPTLGADGIECLNFTRALSDKDMGCGSPNDAAQHINRVTSFVDLSMVYGLNDDLANKLRTFSGGQIKPVIKTNHVSMPIAADSLCVCNYETGDSIANENPEPAMLQTLFVKEHNRIATELAKLNENWDDERLYNEARRILIAIFQSITYYEALPLLIGKDHMIDKKLIYPISGFIDDYDSKLNPNIGQEHANAAYKHFHNLLVEEKNSMARKHMYGISAKSSESSPRNDVCDTKVACGKRFVMDLRAADFQRDRDQGLSYYNDYRKYCNLKEADTWEDLVDIPPQDVEILKTLYKSVDDLDLSVAGSLERLVDGAECGPTFLCILTDQFERTRKGDRFWFENKSSGLSEDQLAEIKKVTAARLYCNNGGGITMMQISAFTVISESNTPLDCTLIPSMDLSKWKE